ncbi:retron system putative HNH endonuclease [Salegentibacter mishustinae]|uniref:retron system putative HNH endonuclease n=1 Tax=Salegentibacter mishustinae TaxID=270918 RepID=UPI0024938EC5|nr:retron system putative HNH endonuclease [Salegentibacter mishustinae]
MIKTLKIKEPQFFKSEQAKQFRKQLVSFYNQPSGFRTQRKFPISGLQLSFNNIKTEILKKTGDKCSYCESELKIQNLTINHFRPKSAAADLEGKISSEHYWWLALDWNNLFPACQICKSNKKNFFPVAKRRATVKYYAKDTLYNKEKPLLIDPEFENPEEYFYYDQNGRIYSDTERGVTTINLLSLNREELIKSRQSVASEILSVLNDLPISVNFSDVDNLENEDLIKKMNSLGKDLNKFSEPYLGIRRFFFRRFINDLNLKPSFKKFLSLDVKRILRLKLKHENENINRESKTNQFEVKTINIKNYKTLSDISINFKRTNNGNAGWAILIGENGVGKSSTLSATLKTLIGRNYRGLSFSKDEINREVGEDASVHITFNDKAFADVHIGKKIRYFHPKDYFIDSSIVAFGPFKHSNKSDKNYRKFKGGCFIDNFFNPAIPLHNSLNFILRLTPEQFEYVAIALLDLLMLENRARIHRNLNTRQVWFQYDESNRKQYFSELSDGYQSVITLGCNIIEGLLLNNESIEHASGFVVIDEIGANLHPRWKMQIVKRLRRTFPNVQFLVTTHDPLCLKGIEEDETYVLQSNNGQLNVLTDLPSPSEFRADQLLTSEFFGLYSTVDPEMEEEFKEYYELLYKPKGSLNKSEEKRLNILKKQLRDKNHLGDSLREELLYMAIDEILAKQKISEKPFQRKEVEEEVKEKAIELIDEFLGDLEE